MQTWNRSGAAPLWPRQITKPERGQGRAFADSTFGDSCKVSLQRAEVQGSLKTSELLMIYHNRVFTKFQAMC